MGIIQSSLNKLIFSALGGATAWKAAHAKNEKIPSAKISSADVISSADEITENNNKTEEVNFDISRDSGFRVAEDNNYDEAGEKQQVELLRGLQSEIERKMIAKTAIDARKEAIREAAKVRMNYLKRGNNNGEKE